MSSSNKSLTSFTLTLHEEHPSVRRRMTTGRFDALLRRAFGARHFSAYRCYVSLLYYRLTLGQLRRNLIGSYAHVRTYTAIQRSVILRDELGARLFALRTVNVVIFTRVRASSRICLARDILRQHQ